MGSHNSTSRVVAAAVGLCMLWWGSTNLGGRLTGAAGQDQVSSRAQFGGTYSTLDTRRRQLVDDWVARFAQTTGQTVPAERLYDEVISVSTKTTFDAIAHALMTTTLSDESGAGLGDALSLVERIETVNGEVPGARSDHQFRMYVRLTANAVETLDRSREFRRGADNSVYHKGYPLNYRGQGGIPSIQFSVALDERRADIDVDYRSSGFPLGLFNGHLTSSNSDVRAGRNYDRHTNRWAGFQNWWRSFFGVRVVDAPEDTPTGGLALSPKPRLGMKSIDLMVNDFLRAWLIEGDIVAAMGYVSDQAFACLAQDLDDPADFDRGMAPYQLMARLKSAHDALGEHTNLEGLTAGVRFTRPGLKVVTQPRHAQFVLYSVPDDIAADFDCESRLTVSDGKPPRRAYGNFYGATFNIAGARDHSVALLWGQVDGYWKLVSWAAGVEDRDTAVPAAPEPPQPSPAPADTTLVQAARDFLDRWLVRKDYDGAFRYLSPTSYPCYDLTANPGRPAATPPAESGPRIREALQRLGERVARGRSLQQLVSPLEPSHPAVRLMTHPYSGTFTLTSVPTALGDAAGCVARANGAQLPRQYPLEYGQAFGMNMRFRTRAGETPVLRLLWAKETGAWRITAFDVESP